MKGVRTRCRLCARLTTRALRIEALEPRQMLATFMVNNLADGGAGSLRQAITDANAATGADAVVFQPGLTGTISLTSGELSISDDLMIHGPGAAEMGIDAAGLSRIFRVDDGTSAYADVSINGLTLSNGREQYGGAILSYEDLSFGWSRDLEQPC